MGRGLALAAAAPTPARAAAFEVVKRVRERSAYAHQTLDKVLAERDLEPKEAASAARLAYGTLSAMGVLEEAIATVVDPGTTLWSPMLEVLALGAWEVLFGGTPAYAAVNETAKLAKAVEPKATGFANAVIRKVARAADTFPWGDPDTDLDARARLYAHPRWLAEMWATELGSEKARGVMAANNQAPPMFLASVLPGADALAGLIAELAAAGAEPSPGPLPGSVRVGKPAAARRIKSLQSHHARVMDLGAQFVVRTMRPGPGQVLAEIGAGRGGKSLMLASTARSNGGPLARLAAVDLHDFKLKVLADDARTLGFSEIVTVTADASSAGLKISGVPPASADAVLVDAPCSGLGTLRRHPEGRWRLTPADCGALQRLQALLLMNAAALVKPGGFVVYSTCTISNAENRDIVRGFLGSKAGSRFVLDSLAGDVPEPWKGFVDPAGWLQLLPEPEGADGHFVARLIRKA